MGFERLNPVVAEHFRLRTDAQHQRHVGAIHVGIEQADLVSQLGQHDGEINGERGLSYAAFAGTDGNDSAHTGQRLRGWRLLLLSGTRGKRRTHGSIIREGAEAAIGNWQ